ncbi:hypothetical protein EXU57_08725 [Segetibacter sp. 3557_3]|uniref:hypothetical protein n=1 Tax=Segetibacter sp. 3557_3 TaxID=2547429 RepID=UPI001058BF6F|nr:hypothetical protein [Segetibacter sp. 3557_3]TDH26880.1 hypothetical protein EXU57_08725 [Segetibacter sp. 3557_3]
MKTVLSGMLIVLSMGVAAQKCGVSINLQHAYASGDFGNVNPGPIPGARLNFTFKPIWQLPLYTGFEVAYQRSLNNSTAFNGATFGTTDLYRLKSRNRVWSALANFRISVPNESALLRPFLEALVGGNNFRTICAVSQETTNGFAKINNTSNGRLGWAFTYGGSAGLNIRLQHAGKSYLQFKTSYLPGFKSRFLSDPWINNDNTASFAVNKLTTDLLIPQAGIYFNLN